VVTVVLLAVWAGSQAAQALGAHTPAGPVHVVKQGETVWQIVVEHYGGRERDVRVVVDRVLAANDLSAATIAPGQELVLPPLPD
jgi:LysM repeat protein